MDPRKGVYFSSFGITDFKDVCFGRTLASSPLWRESQPENEVREQKNTQERRPEGLAAQPQMWIQLRLMSGVNISRLLLNEPVQGKHVFTTQSNTIYFRAEEYNLNERKFHPKLSRWIFSIRLHVHLHSPIPGLHSIDKGCTNLCHLVEKSS